MTIKAVFGGAVFNPEYNFSSPEETRDAFDRLKKEGVTAIDTARLYGKSEEIIGNAAGHEDFVIDTKLMGGFAEGSLKNALADIKDSYAKLKVKQIDILYIHSPENKIAPEEWLSQVQEAYKLGLFKRLGLSNFTAEQVQKVYDVTKSNGWVLPTVYQGNYSAVARLPEKILFPTLRKLGFAFYAYSPIAGGFLTKTKEDIESGKGRFNKEVLGGLYLGMYGKPEFLEQLDTWNKIAEKEGIPKAELAYRWVAHHSALKEELGDAVIFGATKPEQITQTAQYLKKGPLSAEAVKSIDDIWTVIEEHAHVDNFHFVKPGEGH